MSSLFLGLLVSLVIVAAFLEQAICAGKFGQLLVEFLSPKKSILMLFEGPKNDDYHLLNETRLITLLYSFIFHLFCWPFLRNISSIYGNQIWLLLTRCLISVFSGNLANWKKMSQSVWIQPFYSVFLQEWLIFLGYKQFIVFLLTIRWMIRLCLFYPADQQA